MLLALLGGVVLNLMPCVFPVLFLKALSLVQSQRGGATEAAAHGLVYTLGILVSFWVIVAVLLVLRSGGEPVWVGLPVAVAGVCGGAGAGPVLLRAVAGRACSSWGFR